MKESNIFAADFETTVYKGQTDTQVWSSALCPIRTKKMQEAGESKPEEGDVLVHTSIDATYRWAENFDRDLIFYYHNLKFDGSFWVDWLLKHGFTWYEKESRKDDDLPGTFSALIGDMGQWYDMKIVLLNGHVLELRDSLKLMPMSLRSLAQSFHTEHQKLEMEYTGKRVPDGDISNEEMAYIKNDALVLSELMEIMFAEGVESLTIGGACVKKYRSLIGKMYEAENFMDLTAFDAPEGSGSKNADEYIRKAYKGGWCYVKSDKAQKIHKHEFCVADVNSLYPSMMHSMSGNRYPVGMPHFCGVGELRKAFKDPSKYCFLRIKCAFKLKEGYLPFIQIKGSSFYKGTEMLEDSRPTVRGQKYEKIKLKQSGTVISDVVELTLTETDYKLFRKHYSVRDLQVLDGCWFWTDIGLFDEYIDQWAEIKKTSKGAKRQIAKLFLNNLYGKFATSPRNVVKIPQLKEDESVGYVDDVREDKDPWYIAIGAAITSYARNFTITAAQANYDTFCYADTDSIHCLCKPEEVKGIRIHPVNFCCWKVESEGDVCVFYRQKTYVEHTTIEDGEPVEKPYYNVKCAGMPKSCKDLFIESMEESEEKAKGYANMAKILKAQNPDKEKRTEKQDELIAKYDFLAVKRSLEDFKVGLSVPGKLMPRRISGGTLLADSYFTIN